MQTGALPPSAWPGNTVNVYNGTSHVALEDSNRVGVPGSDGQVERSRSAQLLCRER